MKWLHKLIDVVKKCGKPPVAGVPAWSVERTPRANMVLALAKNDAERLHHHFIGTEHVLFGLAKLGQGVAINILRRSGFDAKEIRKLIEASIAVGPEEKSDDLYTYTASVEKILELASQEAKSLHHNFVGTEHLLLGMIAEGDGVAGKILREKCHLSLDETRMEIIRELDPNFNPGAASTQ